MWHNSRVPTGVGMNKILKSLESYSDDHVFTVGQVAALLERHRDRVHDYIRKGRLSSTFNETHRAYEIKAADLRSFVTKDFLLIPQRKGGKRDNS